MVQPTKEWPLPEAIIVDLDGTISNYQDRKHFLGSKLGERHDGKGPNWDKFNRESVNDRPMKEVIRIVQWAHAAGIRIIIMTGRSDRYLEITKYWLELHKVPCTALLMRKQGDFRPDIEVKGELYATHCAQLQILFVLEDRDPVVAFWRSIGLRCLQVRKGDY